jgi:uncharacterized membrane protein YdjX (TVP38/TMEM64 family)
MELVNRGMPADLATDERAPAGVHTERVLHLQTRQRLLVLVLVVVALAVLMSSAPLHDAIRGLVDQIAALMEDRPVLGVLAFSLLSVLSAMVAFFSTAILVPVAVYAWGRETTLIILWSSWLIGGCCAYAIGRTLGRRVASWLVDPARLDYYTRRVPEEAGFFTILLFQLALPSEVPGYVLGAIRYRFATYLLVLAITEVPFAFGAVYLGDGFLQRNYSLLLGIGLTGILVMGLAFRALHRRLPSESTSRSVDESTRPSRSVDESTRPSRRVDESTRPTRPA